MHNDYAEFPLKVPDRIDGDGILVAWSLEHEHARQPIGFHFGDPVHTPEKGYLDPILFDGDGHLMTVAPTGSGKGTGCIIPTLLRYPGPVIVVDPKGENVAVTGRRRRELGQRVVVLDPFGVTEMESDRLDPLDSVVMPSDTVVDDVAMLVELIAARGSYSARDQFWIRRGNQLLIGLILHLLHTRPRKLGLLSETRTLLNSDQEELQQMVAGIADSSHPEVRALGAALGIAAQETVGGYLAFAQNSLDFLRGEAAGISIAPNLNVPAGNAPVIGNTTAAAGASGTWIINEIHADPDGAAGDANGDGSIDASEDEFVEIINDTGAAVDMSGFTLSDGAQVRHTFASTTIVPQGHSVVIFGGGTPTGSFGNATVETASTGALNLDDAGDTVTLQMLAVTLDTVTYGAEGGNDESITRDPDVTGTLPLVGHSTATGSGGSLFSPGAGVDGSTFFGASAAGVTVAQGNTITGCDFGDATGPAILGDTFGTLTVSMSTINNTIGPAMDLTNGTLALGFTDVASSGGYSGIALDTVDGTLTVTGATTLEGSTETAVRLESGAAATLMLGTTAIGGGETALSTKTRVAQFSSRASM